MTHMLKTAGAKKVLSKIKKNTKKFVNQYQFKDILSQLTHVDIEIKEIKVKKTIIKDKTIMKFHKLFNTLMKEYEQTLINITQDHLYNKECLDKIFKNYTETSKEMLKISSLGWELLYYDDKLFFKKILIHQYLYLLDIKMAHT